MVSRCLGKKVFREPGVPRARSSNMNRRKRMVDKAGGKRGGRAGYKIFPGCASASRFRLDATASTQG